MAILVTGGTGFIGSHTTVELLNSGIDVVALDNFSNSKPEVINRIKAITGKDFKFYRADLLCREELETVFSENDIDSVIHFAGLKAVGESVEKPLEYYHNNITGTLILAEVMKKYNTKNIVFSSSATVYGDPATVPIKEDFPISATNPYGRTKLMIESILTDLCVSDKDMSVSILRYFNPIGAHESGMIGEEPKGIPNNLMPYILKVASGQLACLNVYGNDYPTRDGTGVRDYIHVVDLAKAHIFAYKRMITRKGVECFNIGTGKGYSVLEVVDAFEKVNNVKINRRICERRHGDIAECYADPSKAKEILGWTASYGIVDMCRDAYRWLANNPDGYN